MNYWLLKSEPDVFGFADLQTRVKKTEPWNGVRNYQARNYMRDGMSLGDLGLFYHSNCDEPGVAGIVRISREAYADPTQFDPSSEYFDPKATEEAPRWLMVDVTWHADFPTHVSLSAMKAESSLADMLTLRKGNRLSITPVDPAHFRRVCQMGGHNLKHID
jgi:predicted RNA-binding protein with PUA-like domain